MEGPFNPAIDSADMTSGTYRLYDQLPVAIASLKGQDLVIEYTNSYQLSLWQRTSEEVLGKALFDVMPGYQVGAEDIHAQVYRTGRRHELREMQVEIKVDGKIEYRYLSLTIDPTFDGHGNIIGQLTTTIDETEQVTARKEAEESKEKYRSLFNTMEQGFCIIKMIFNEKDEPIDYCFLEINPIFSKLTGLENALGKTARQLLPDLEEHWFQIYGRVALTGESMRFIEGSEVMGRWFEVHAFSVGHPSKRQVALLFNDITERKKTEVRLRKSEQHLELLSNTVPAMIFYLDEEQRYRSCNETFGKWFGVNPNEAIGKTVREFIGEAAYQKVLPHLSIAYAGEQEKYEMQFPVKSSDEKWLSIVYTPHKNEAGKVTGVIVHATDITRNKHIELTLRESQNRFQNLVREASIGIILLTGREMKVMVVNDAYGRLIGRTAAELLGKNLFEVIPETTEVYSPLLEKVLQSGEPLFLYDAPYSVNKDGIMIKGFLNVVCQPYRETDEKVTGVLVLCHDVTESVTAKVALQESKAQFEDFSNNIQNLAWMADGSGWIYWYNQRWYDYTGTTIDEMQGWGWEKVHHRDHRDRVVSFVKEAWHKVEPFELTFPLRGADGVYRWFLTRAVPILGENGKITRWIGTNTNINEQVELSEKLEDLVTERTRELQRSNEDLQQFAHVASHDLKEPVRKVMTFSSRLRDELKNITSERGSLYLSKIESAGLRMYSMIDGVLLYSSLTALEQSKEKVDLNTVIHEIENDLEILIQQKGAIIKSTTLPVIEGSKVLLYQLFYNLINNSLKFAREGEPSKIFIESEYIKMPTDNGLKGNGEKSFVRITIQDNGIGFEQSKAVGIFQTFSRLNSKDKYEGTGLGLALCKKIVERHNGTINAEGQVGVGAKFIIELPQ